MTADSRWTSAIEGAGAQPLGTKHRLRYLAALPLGGCTSASSVADESNDDSTGGLLLPMPGPIVMSALLVQSGQ
jgi:hypothetical protein